MMLPFLSDYSTGTITLTEGSDAFTGAGVDWALAGLKPGDTVFVPGFPAIPIDTIASSAGTLKWDWPHATQAGVPYYIFRTSLERFTGLYQAEQQRDLNARIGNAIVYRVTGEAPDNGIGADDSLALKITSAGGFKAWLKAAGNWGSAISLTPSFANDAAMVDTNDNELLQFGVTASAVNHWKMSNAAAAAAVLLAVVGGDTNVSARYATKGTGEHIWQINAIDELKLSATALYPASNDGSALGIKNTNAFSDLFLANGGVIDWNNGNVTLTHSSGLLTLSGSLTFSSTVSFAPQLLAINGHNGTSGPYFIVRSQRDGAANNGATQVNDDLGTFMFQGKDTSGVARNGAYISSLATAVDASSVVGKLIFVSNTSMLDLTATRALVPLTTASTSSTTGAMVVSGGLGVAGAINAGGVITSVAANGFVLSGAAATARRMVFATSGASRWQFGVTGDPESGSNAGSNFAIMRFDDTATFLANALNISRDSGVVSIPATTSSSSTTSGALIVSGGLGVAGNIYSGGRVRTTSGFGFEISVAGTGNAVLASGWNASGAGGVLLGYQNAGPYGYIAEVNNSGTWQADIIRFVLATRNVVIPTTTVSTSTTTGALTVGGGLGVAGAAYLGGNLTISSTAPNLIFYDSDAGTDGKFWSLLTNGTTMTWRVLNDAAGGSVNFMQITRSGTTVSSIAFLGGGVILGAPTGGAKGAGTLNAAGDIYKNDSAYTNPDYVFEAFYEGKIERFADKDGAAAYRGLMPLDELRAYTREHLRLPGFTDEAMGIFARADLVLEKFEELTLYTLDLHERGNDHDRDIRNLTEELLAAKARIAQLESRSIH
jgi:hypothetical protein